jgi:hypothetical protein
MPIKEGSIVEVSQNIPHMKGSVYEANVIQIKKNKYTVQYKTLKDEKNNPIVEVVTKGMVRPVPPVVIAPPAVGDIVDVPWIGGWWKAQIVEVQTSVVVVKFEEMDKIAPFNTEEVRIHQKWDRRTPSRWSFLKVD